MRAEHATLEDLGSKNGTWRGETRVTSPVTLSNGDEIRLGSVSLRFVSVSQEGSTETRA